MFGERGAKQRMISSSKCKSRNSDGYNHGNYRMGTSTSQCGPWITNHISLIPNSIPGGLDIDYAKLSKLAKTVYRLNNCPPQPWSPQITQVNLGQTQILQNMHVKSSDSSNLL